MCMMFEKEANYSIPENYFDSLWSNNSDGFGAYNYTTRDVFKTLVRQEALDYLKNHHEDKLFVHFRFSTGGTKTADNIHPFTLGQNMILFHNGVLTGFKASAGKSDTNNMAQFFKDLEKPLFDDLDEKNISFQQWNSMTNEEQEARRMEFQKELITNVTEYLEASERGSRFTLIDTVTGATHTPSCAVWTNHTTKDGHVIKFSNSYAIDHWVLYGTKKTEPYKAGGYYREGKWLPYTNQTTTTPTTGGGAKPSNSANKWLYDDVDDFGKNSDILSDMLAEDATISEIKDFILDHPETVAYFLRDNFKSVPLLTLLDDDSESVDDLNKEVIEKAAKAI